MEWLSESIKIWFFPRQNIPSDINSGTPNPSQWSPPILQAGGDTCNIDSHFRDMALVIDTTFCGVLAASSAYWETTSCYKANPVESNTCVNYVRYNPQAYTDAYWTIKSIEVYQLDNATASVTSIPALAHRMSTPEKVTLSSTPAQNKVFLNSSTITTALSPTVDEESSLIAGDGDLPKLDTLPHVSSHHYIHNGKGALYRRNHRRKSHLKH
jgi:hypothetical protein